MPLERLEDDEVGLRAFAMGRMLAEQDSGVNGCEQRQTKALWKGRKRQALPNGGMGRK